MEEKSLRRKSKLLPAGVVLLVLFVAYCKLDLCQVLNTEFEPISTHISIPKLEVAPYLLSNAWKEVDPPIFLRCRIMDYGPLSFRLDFRDFGKTYQKVRVSSIILTSPDKTWRLKLRLPEDFIGWRVIEQQEWTNDFNETWVFAVVENSNDRAWLAGDIVPPNGIKNIFLDLAFELQDVSASKSVSERFTLQPEGTTYFSHLFAVMISK